MKGWLAGAIAALTLALAAPVWATTAVLTRPGFDTLTGCPSVALTPCWKPWDATNPLPVSGSFSATLAGWQPTPSYSQLAASDTANHSVAVPSGVDDVISNLDTTIAYCNFGAASTTSTFPLAPGANFGIHNGGSFATLQCQSPNSSLKVTISGGAGLFTGAGGGGGGGSGGGGPLGVQVISNSQSVNPATSSVWNATTTAAADTVVATGNITTADTGVTCNMSGSGQNVCTGTPTPGSFVTGTITAEGNISVNGTLSGGTVTMQSGTEISQDNVNWYPRGLFLDGNVAPIWKSEFGAPFSGVAPGGGVGFYRIRATTFTTLTGTPSVAITIKAGQQVNMMYIGNLPTSGAGSSALAAVNIQGETAGVPVIVNESQLGGAALGAAVGAGSSATGNIQAVQGVSGGTPVPVSGSFSTPAFVPGATAITPFSATSTSSNATIPTGSTTLIITAGSASSAIAHCTLGATAVGSDQAFQPGESIAFNVTSATQFACITSSGTQNISAVAGSGQFQAAGGGPATVAAAGVSANNAIGVQGVTGGLALPISAAALPLPAGAMQQTGGSVTIAGPLGAQSTVAPGVSVTDTGVITTGYAQRTGGVGTVGIQSQIDLDIQAPVPAGTNLIGKFGIDQTTQGTTNGVSIVGCSTGICGLPTVTSNALVFGPATAAMTGTTSTQVLALVASQRLYINAIHCNNSSSTGTLVQIRDGVAGTVLDVLAAGPNFGGDNRNAGTGALYATTVGNALYAQDVTTAASVICQASGWSSAN